MTEQFVGLHIEDGGAVYPIATGQTRDDTMRKTMTRVLVNPWLRGSIQIQEWDIEPESFNATGLALDAIFSGAHPYDQG